MITFSRRHVLAGSAAFGAAALSGAGPARAADFSDITVWGMPGAPSVSLAHLVSRNALNAHADVRFDVWRSPDRLRAGVASGTMFATAAPSYVAANMANRGTGARLLNVMTWGLLYLVSSDDAVTNLADLAGKKIVMPFKNDMPDLVFRHIARADGMTPGRDVAIDYVSNPIQALKLLIAGRVDTAVLPEPAATGALMQGKAKAMPIRRVLALQEEWGRVNGRVARIPQAGMMIADRLLQAKPDFVRDLHLAMVESVAWARSNPAEAGRLGAGYLGMKAPMVERSIPYSNLTAVSAAEARADLEHFFAVLAKTNPAIVGGGLPGDDFYLSV